MKTLLFISLLIALAFGKKTYPIAEPDLLEEIERKLPEVERRIKKELEKYNEDYFQEQVHKSWRIALPLAQKSKKEVIDWVYELEFDIPRVDDKGNVIGVLYPKGYRFRPIQHWVVSPPVLIVFDGRDKKQVQIVKKLLPKYPYRMLIASDGRVFDLMKEFNERVFLLHPKLRSVAKIKEGVSIINWDRKNGYIIKEVVGKDALEGSDK